MSVKVWKRLDCIQECNAKTKGSSGPQLKVERNRYKSRYEAFSVLPHHSFTLLNIELNNIPQQTHIAA
jgi:hypothetical protein